MNDRSPQYVRGSLTLGGAVSMGLGVMIGAAIFALTGQVAELAGEWFPVAFIAAAVVVAFSAYSYVKLSNAFPSAGGIAMYLEKAYGRSWVTGVGALLMYFAMIINQSFVARTFGTYTLQLFEGVANREMLVPLLGVGLLLCVFLVNILGNKVIEATSFVLAFVKVGGILLLGIGGLWAAGISLPGITHATPSPSIEGFLSGAALAVIAFAGFTTITNSGSEIVDPHRNVGRAIIIAISLCTVLYLLVTFAVGSSLSIAEIIRARDYSLAEAARPTFGDFGLWFTVIFAIVATVSGVIASVFAVSRMLAMLTQMKLVPHRHFGMPGDIQKHTLVYTIVIAIVLTIFFDLTRIAALGAIFYIVMDIAVHWGVFTRLRTEVGARPFVLIAAIVLDGVVLAALVAVKAGSDMLVIYAAIVGIGLMIAGERLFLRRLPAES